MAYTVAIAFRTRDRRFSPGDPITPADVAGDVSFGDWLNGGFIVAGYSKLTTTISSGNSLSSAIPLNQKVPVSIAMPAGWDAADLTFQVSVDGGVTWNELFNDSNTAAQIQVSQGRVIRLVPSEWTGIDWLKIRSGLAGAAVNQTADRVLTITASTP